MIVDCWLCDVERGCCKKRKLTLAMTSQILHVGWLKQHQHDLQVAAMTYYVKWQMHYTYMYMYGNK